MEQVIPITISCKIAIPSLADNDNCAKESLYLETYVLSVPE